MSLLIDVLLLLFGFTGTLAAFGGETWITTDEPLLKRITKRGWISLSCLLLALTFGIVKEIRNNHSSAVEFEKRKDVEEQLRQTREQLASANNRLKDISSQVREIPRQTHSEYIAIPPHGEQQLRTQLYGGDEFRYAIPCKGLYLKTEFATYYLNPDINSIIIAGISGRPMDGTIVNNSSNSCHLKGNVYSIVRH